MGVRAEIRTFETPTRSAEEAAATLGCAVAQIVKSLIFKTSDSARPVLVLVSGANQVDEPMLGLRIAGDIGGEKLARADAAYVRAVTGFAIGGVPPMGHEIAPHCVVLDEDLMAQPTLWAAAGAPNAVFEITPAELDRITGARVLPVK